MNLEPLNGRIDTALTQTVFTQWVPRTYSINPADLITEFPPSDGMSVQTAAARSNPGRVSLNLPVAIAELRDIPHLVKFAGQQWIDWTRAGRTPYATHRYLENMRHARSGAGIYLGYEFGIRPVLSDLEKIIGFTALVDRRVNELQRLYSNGGLRRRITTFEKTDSDSSVDTINSDFGLTISARKHRQTTQKKWVVIRWLPTAFPHFRNGANIRSFVRSLISGSSGRGHQVVYDLWEATPWTWLFDWFNHVGDFMQAHSGAVPCQMGRCSVMYQTETTVTWSRIGGNQQITGGSAQFHRTRKKRAIGVLSPLPQVSIPFLNGGQLSILGSLALLGRNRPRVGGN